MTRTYEDTIVYFNKTPPGIACPHFFELRWAFGCNFDCQWCYLLLGQWRYLLLGTSFGKKHFRTYDKNATLNHVAGAFQEIRDCLLVETPRRLKEDLQVNVF
jgi:hypothetical protein